MNYKLLGAGQGEELTFTIKCILLYTIPNLLLLDKTNVLIDTITLCKPSTKQGVPIVVIQTDYGKRNSQIMLK